MSTGKKLLFALCLLVCSSAPATTAGAEQMYQVTESQLNELQTIYGALKTQSTEQQTLLTEQKSQIETLNKQLATSETQIKNSRIQLAQAQAQLTDLEQSWKKSEASRRKTEARLERQRNTWAIAAALFFGVAALK